MIYKSVWSCAQSQGESADKCIEQLRSLSGEIDMVPRKVSTRRFPLTLRATSQHSECALPCPSCSSSQPMPVPSLMDLRLRRDLASAWNAQVSGMYDVAKRWC